MKQSLAPVEMFPILVDSHVLTLGFCSLGPIKALNCTITGSLLYDIHIINVWQVHKTELYDRKYLHFTLKILSYYQNELSIVEHVKIKLKYLR